jgi:4-diphosphocytidyl-2-C-methyl-D-erythritol kinase
MDVKAYAKVNLGLRVIGKRPDGFHNIETIFHRINLFDELSIFEHNSISITSTEPKLPTNNDNLCWKAIEFLMEVSKSIHGAKIHIDKKIPVGAGLGGGSSDAASLLKNLPLLIGEKIDQAILLNIALNLGSDVPFFLQNETAYAEGRGEELSPLNYSIPYWIVLVNPGIHVSTPWAYKTLSEKRNGIFPVRPKLNKQLSLSSSQYLSTMENDFEEVVFEKYPAIGEIKKTFLDLDAFHALMSGSGSSVFGLFDDETAAKNAANVFQNKFFVSLTEPNFTIA